MLPLSEHASEINKRRRIHLDSVGCFSLANSKLGAQALSSPLVATHRQPLHLGRRLLPRIPRKPRQKLYQHTALERYDQDHQPVLTIEEDFQNNQSAEQHEHSISLYEVNMLPGFKRVSDLPFSSNPEISPSGGTFKRARPTLQSNTVTNYFKSAVSKISENLEIPNTSNNTKDDIIVLYESCTKTKLSHSPLNKLPRKAQNDPYGLLGGCDELNERKTVSSLPDELLELIFHQLPILDLLLSQARVCTRWNKIIKNDKFIPWKKHYYSLKFNRSEEKETIRNLCLINNMKSAEDCFLGLIKYMKKFPHKPSTDMVDCLRKHKKYLWAEELLKVKYPESLLPIPNAWCIITALVILASSVQEISQILSIVSFHHNSCNVPDVIECLYCLATFFLHFKDEIGINQGFHYRAYYALYLYENRCPVFLNELNPALEAVRSGQQSILKYGTIGSSLRLTHEQMHIINHKLDRGQVVKIIAFAGTGKTTTLLQYTKLRPGLKFLNVMFNKAVCEHAKNLFPSNVECRTAHSLAYRAVGFKYRVKLTSNLRPLDIQSFLKAQKVTKNSKHALHYMAYSRLVVKTLDTFVASEDPEIDMLHVPMNYFCNSALKLLSIAQSERQNMLTDARSIWQKMCEVKDSDVRMTHDGYLKLYQLTKPHLEGYDCILVDEGQDCNMAMLNIVLSQECPKIIVGDPHQQIYSFRGAVNALNNVEATNVYYLTQSFRFGPEVAYVANCALEVLKSVKHKTLVGGKQTSFINGRQEGQLAVIARTNFALFREAVNLCCMAKSGENLRGAFTGGITSYKFDQLLDIQILLSRGDYSRIHDRFIRRFNSFNTLYCYAEHAADSELMGKIKLVRTYGEAIIEHVKKIKERCRFSCRDADVVFSTVHKAKGLEFDTVRVLDDFVIGSSKPAYEIPKEYPIDEFNLLYVAVTRAKKALIMSHIVYYMLLWTEEKLQYFAFPRLTDKDIGSPTKRSSLHCAQCRKSFNPSDQLMLYQVPLKLSSGKTISGGELCLQCSTDPVFRPEVYHPDCPFDILPLRLDKTSSALFKLIGPINEPIPQTSLPHDFVPLNL